MRSPGENNNVDLLDVRWLWAGPKRCSSWTTSRLTVRKTRDERETVTLTDRTCFCELLLLLYNLNDPGSQSKIQRLKGKDVNFIGCHSWTLAE